MKVKLEISAEIEVEFDETSEEFKNLFDNYNTFQVECDHFEFAEIIANEIAHGGQSNNIEGIGLIKINGAKQRQSYFPLSEEINHPINIIADFNNNGMIEFITLELD